MPFTPFHAGAGLFGKGLAPKSQSLVLFVATQVAIDLQPGFAMLTGKGELHGWSHTFAGAFFLAGCAALLWKVIEQRTKWGKLRLPYLSNRQLFWTAVWGSVSHIGLDVLCHAEMYSAWGFYKIGMENAEIFAVLLGLMGLAFMAISFGLARLSKLRQSPFWRKDQAARAQPPGE